ncbi:hypothetical protein ACN4EG_07575 [Alkalinema pantanalense CENA528]|uniref:hypothetical protein n=1 Tax=Alkalinema pantanalense TaxID=1620705 RepID=UPI003D6EC317
MSTASRYWKLVKLDNTGRSRAQELPAVKAFILSHFPEITDSVNNLSIQQQLMDWMQDAGSTGQASQSGESAQSGQGSQLAELSLRSFISNQIEQVCIQLEMQFGENHGFRRTDLFPFVLDDDGSTQPRAYKPLSKQILESFDPRRGSLSTWTVRLVKHHRELNRFLLECGVYLLSDWAILNDTTPKKLEHILSSYQPLTPGEIQQAQRILESYHAVYRRDRLQQRQAGVKGSCPQPTDEQLQEMAQWLQTEQLDLTPAAVLRQLRMIADRIRQYRVWAKGGSLKTSSLDEGENFTLADRIADKPPEEESGARQFLQVYRQGFTTSLQAAMQQVVADRTTRLKAPKSAYFLQALQLFHCKGLSMTEIAKQVGLQAQYQVTRLLNLKALREDIRHALLNRLQEFVLEKAAQYVTPEEIQALDRKIAEALNEQIDKLMEEAAAQAQTPKDYVQDYASGSLFAKTLCQHLDELQPIGPSR